jgi:hypothetical protein
MYVVSICRIGTCRLPMKVYGSPFDRLERVVY